MPDLIDEENSRSSRDAGSANVVVHQGARNAIIIAIGNVILVPRWLRDRFSLYLRRPLHFFLDLPWWAMLFSLLLSATNLVFVLLYYGSDAKLFSGSWSLFFIAYLEKLVLYIGVSALATAAVFLMVLWLRRHRAKGKTLPGLPWGINSMQYAMLSPLVLALLTALLFGFAHLTRQRLIPLNTNISLERAHELVSAGLFDQGREILVQLPARQHLPPYAVEHTDQSTTKTGGWDDSSRVKTVIDPILNNDFNKKQYDQAILTICRLQREEDMNNALPWLREAIYILAHNVNIGPERVKNWLDQVEASYPLCQKIVSPFWMSIPPLLADDIDAKKGVEFSTINLYDLYSATAGSNNPGLDQQTKSLEVRSGCTSKYDEPDKPGFTARSCEYDMQLLERYLKMYPDDAYADVARFLIGEWDEIIAGGYQRNPHVLDMAYYEKGRKQYRAKDFEGAIHTYQSFLYLDVFADHRWRDDAQWRIARAYVEMGRYKDALAHLSAMENETDGNVPGYAEMRHSVFYLADVTMSVDELQQAVDLNLFPNIRPILLYTLGERQLVENNFEEAIRVFNQVIEQYGGTPILPGKPDTYGDLAKEKIGVTKVLKGYRDRNTPDFPLLVAGYIETYDSFSPFENGLRFYIRLYAGEEIPISYLTRRSQQYLTASLRENYLAGHPDDPRKPELLYKIAVAYETVASWDLLPGSQQFLIDTRTRAQNAYLQYIEQYPNDNPAYFDRALEHLGSLFIERCLGLMGIGDGDCSLDSIQSMRENYVQLINRYPDHHLANNLANWVAWSYCYEANTNIGSEKDYRENYEKALETYQMIARKYPDGLIGQNAREAIPIIQAKLSNTAKRKPVDTARWGWFNSNK